jgi:hypothetical protein
MVWPPRIAIVPMTLNPLWTRLRTRHFISGGHSLLRLLSFNTGVEVVVTLEIDQMEIEPFRREERRIFLSLSLVFFWFLGSREKERERERERER